MKITREIPADVLPCSSNYLSGETQPYYIVAPGYDHSSDGARLLHGLCSILNQWGYESYMESPAVSGELWTPVLTQAVKLAHYKAGKKPIVVCSEEINGRPLNLGLLVRYLLNGIGKSGRSEMRFAEGELVFSRWRTGRAGAMALNLR